MVVAVVVFRVVRSVLLSSGSSPSQEERSSPSPCTHAGFESLRALRRHNNDVGAALAGLTAAPASLGRVGNTIGGGGGNNDEALAVLQSLGVPPEAAQQVLSRTGTLCDALRELGISGGPDGEAGTGGSSGGGSGGGWGTSNAEGGEGSGDDESQGEDDEGSEGGEDDPGSEPTPEEKRLFDELAADRENQDEEGYLDVTLEDEADAADM